jgi:small GTP-binding protein
MKTSKLKMILVGNSQCGKSSLLQQFVHHRFEPSKDMTIGVDLSFKTVKLLDKHVKLQIWDTAGQEAFHSITRIYYRGANVVLLVYDVTNEHSFVHVRSWLDRIQSVWKDDYSPMVMLVGNKSDLVRDRVISREEGELFARRHDMMFAETSAKVGENVEDAFLLPVLSFMKNHPDLLEETDETVFMETDAGGEDRTSGCCWW